MKLKINAVMRTATPFHSAVSESWRYNPETHRIMRDAKNSQLAPINRTRHHNLGGGTYLAVVPEMTFRKRLRKHAARKIFDHFNDNGMTVSMDLYHSMLDGTASGHPEQQALTIEEMAEMQKNIFSGVFGGGAAMIPSKLVTPTIYPITETTTQLGITSAKAEPVPDNDLTMVELVIRSDSLEKFPELDAASRYIRNFEEAYDLYQRMNNMEKAEKDNLHIRSMSYMEVVRPNVPFELSITLNAPSPAQAGLILMALQNMPEEHLGGLGNTRGYGRFKWEMVEGDFDGVPFSPMDETDETTAELIAAAEEEIADLDPDVLERIYEDPWLAGKKEKATA